MLENKKFKSADGKFEIGIDPDGSYGYFEHEVYGDELGGGLWFENGELVDFDGCCVLPREVGEALVKEGFTVDLELNCE